MPLKPATLLILTATAVAGLVFLAPPTSVIALDAPEMQQPDVRPVEVIQDRRPVLRVSGRAEVQRRPDYAIVTVGVDVRDPAAAAAAERGGEAMAKVVEVIERMRDGVQVEASDVRLSAAYRWEQAESRQILIGYDASGTLRIRIDNPAKAGKVIDAAIAAGANRVDGVSFELTQAGQARQEAIRLATAAARDKAEALADGLDMHITGVVEATASNGDQNWGPQPMANISMAGKQAGGYDGALSPGFITVTADVSVVYTAQLKR